MKKLLLLLLFIASSAYGEIYTWKDSRGTAHYTNSEYDIPERYRAKAKVLNLGIVEKKDNSSPQQDATSQPNAPPQQNEQPIQPVKPAQTPVFQSPAGNSKKEHPANKLHGRAPEE